MTDAISIDSHVLRCATHGGVMSIESHHAIKRSQGGTDGPTIYVCSDCHRMFTEERWGLTWGQDGFSVWDKETGKQLMRRIMNPDFDQSLYLDNLEKMRGLMDRAYPDIPYLDDEGVLAAAATSKAWGKAAQMYQMALILEAHLRSVYGHRVELLKDLGAQIGVSLSTVQNRLKVAQTYEMQRLEMLEEIAWKPTLLAANSDDPQGNLDKIQDMQESGMGPENIYRTMKGQAPINWEPCPTCGHIGDSSKWKERLT